MGAGLMQGSWPTLIGELTALAMVVAISPFSVIPAILLVLQSTAPRRTSLAFVAGWLTGKAAITAVFVQVPRLVGQSDESSSGWASAGVKIVLGLVLVAGGLWSLRRPQKAVQAPKWLVRLKAITPAWAAAVGVALTLVNPKVVFACAAAGYAIGNAHLGVLGITGGVAYFTAIAGSTATVPILAYAISAHRVDPLLERLVRWMQRRSRALLVGILIVVGIVLVLAGIGGV